MTSVLGGAGSSGPWTRGVLLHSPTPQTWPLKALEVEISALSLEGQTQEKGQKPELEAGDRSTNADRHGQVDEMRTPPPPSRRKHT